MNIINELSNYLQEILKGDDRPIVVFSSAWPFFRAIGHSDNKVVEELLQIIIDATAESSLLMPTFSNGYNNGICDLDTAPSTTGVISDAFRRRDDTMRTLSAFFSFSVMGSAIPEVFDLMPKDAWGDGSIYHWMELKNARFLMLGVDPTHCSYLHRIEWLLRDLISYRYVKTFKGILYRKNINIQCRERLFVRHLNPEAINDFTGLNGTIKKSGIKTTFIRGIPVTLYDANQILTLVLPLMEKDPFIAISNKNDFKELKNDY